MDEVRIERLKQKYGEKCLLVIIQDWPDKYQRNQEPRTKNREPREPDDLVASLEYLVNILVK